MVGREREQAALLVTLDGMLAGHGSLVLISGEAGIGKSTLVEWLGQQAESAGCLVIRGGCYDLSVTPPYGPWLELTTHYQPGADGPPLPAFFTDRAALERIGSQQALFDQATAFFLQLTERQPTVFVLEDLHWADPGSIEFLRFLARHVTDRRFMLTVTHRSDELARFHLLSNLLPAIVRESRVERIAIQRLNNDGIQQLIRDRVDLSTADQSRLVSYLEARAEGNPLFAGELLRTLEEDRILRYEDGRWLLGDLSSVSIPLLLRQVIDGRLVRLREAARLSLAQAAVIGQDVSMDLWMTVAGLSELELLDVTERAISARLLDPIPDGVRFVHALIREAIYDSVLPVRRRAWHRQVAEALLDRSTPDADRVAHHFQQANDERATEWLIKAGDRAQRAYAYVAAGDQFEAALALLDRSDTTVGERGWLLWRVGRMRRFSDQLQSMASLDEALACARQADDHVLIGNALLDRGMILPQHGRVRLGLSDMEAGVATLQRLTSAEQRRLRDLPSILEVADEVVAEANVIPYLSVAGRVIEARTRGEQIINAMPATSSPNIEQRTVLSEAFLGMARAYAILGLAEESLRAFDCCGELYAETGHYMALGVALLTELDQLLIPYYADRPSERRRIAAEAETAFAKANAAAPDQPARIAGVPLLILEGEWATARQVLDSMPRQVEPFPNVLRAAIAIRQGDVEIAWQLVREAFPAGPKTQPGDSDFTQLNRMQYVAATLALDAGNLVAARDWLEAHDHWLDWAGAVLGRAESSLAWAHWHHLSKDLPAARDMAQRALEHASNPRQPLTLLAVHRLLGQLDTEEARFEEAGDHLQESLNLSTACAAPFERALTLLARAELRIAQRRPDDAAAHLDEIRAICAAIRREAGAETRRRPRGEDLRETPGVQGFGVTGWSYSPGGRGTAPHRPWGEQPADRRRALSQPTHRGTPHRQHLPQDRGAQQSRSNCLRPAQPAHLTAGRPRLSIHSGRTRSTRR